MSGKHHYALTIDLAALNHLGLNLYSNIPAVLSEVVANSWDADAETVSITIDEGLRAVEITDDGAGMSERDINDKYLRVGYRKRDVEGTHTPKHRRHVMGRKGIGKLSLFSIAGEIEVHSVIKRPDGISERNGFIMNAAKITEAIKKAGEGGHAKYEPEVVAPETIDLDHGTRIRLRQLKPHISLKESFLRRRLARRFSVISARQRFAVAINDVPISVTDRDYFPKLQYLWIIGEDDGDVRASAKNVRQVEVIDGVVDDAAGYRIQGWIGTFDEQKSIDENNTIVVLAWGKLVQEDLLKNIDEAGLFTKYLIGELRADFLDDDHCDDIATSDRQRLKEDDPRFNKLKEYVGQEIVRKIKLRWTEWRTEGATETALATPAIRTWFEGLGSDNRKYAKRIFGKIESLPTGDAGVKRELYKQSILAFESLALQNHLQALDAVETVEELQRFTEVFKSMDELEATHYYQIAKSRLEVLRKLEKIVPESREKFIQKHIFDHLWLLDPSWERASTDARMEQSVTKELKGVVAKLSKDERAARLDIRYRTAAGKHIVIELKRASRVIQVDDLSRQVRKYRTALQKVLKAKHPGEPHLIEIICLVGATPEPADDDEANRANLAAYNARYITYEQLIQQTRDSYRDYLDKEKELSRIQQILNEI